MTDVRLKRRKSHVPRPAVRRLMRFAYRRRAALAAMIIIAICLYLGVRIWEHVADDVSVRADYRLEPHQIQISPLPSWIHSDIKAEALRDGSLDGPQSILDEQLAVRLKTAFALHPWVSRVVRVAKHYPAGVTIELAYRRPAAMVEVRQGLFPIDEQAVLLPSGDFSTAEARTYPRIAGIDSQPLGPPGTPWGDTAVVEAVAIVKSLGEIWNDLAIERVQRVVLNSGHFAAQEYRFELVTRGGASIPWGRAPGHEESQEASASEKVMRLKEYIRRNHNIDNLARRIDLDLRAQKPLREADRLEAQPNR
jgi:hypothetical protein